MNIIQSHFSSYEHNAGAHLFFLPLVFLVRKLEMSFLEPKTTMVLLTVHAVHIKVCKNVHYNVYYNKQVKCIY